MVGARHPHGVEAPHAVVARQAVHDRLVERMAHVQRARHVGWRQLDGEGGLARTGAPVPRWPAAPYPRLFPFGAPVGFQCSRFKRLGQAFEAGLLQGRAHGSGSGVRQWGPWGRSSRRERSDEQESEPHFKGPPPHRWPRRAFVCSVGCSSVGRFFPMATLSLGARVNAS